MATSSASSGMMSENDQNINQEINREVRVVMILDESGSMESNKIELLQSVNAFIKKQQAEMPESCKFSLFKFNNVVKLVMDDIPVGQLQEFTDDQYTPNNVTALYDAMGEAIMKFSEKKYVVLVIVTDGEENASKQYNKDTIKQLLKERVNPDSYGWNVIYLCKEPNLEKQGESLGISNHNDLGYSNSSVGFTKSVTYEQLSLGISNFAKGVSKTVSIRTNSL